MINLYNEKELPNLYKKRNQFILLVVLGVALAIIFEIICFFLTNRENLLLMEIISIILMFVSLSFSAFVGTYFLRNVLLRIKIIKSFSLINTPNEIYEGEIKYADGNKKYYGFTFKKIMIDDKYFFVEENVNLDGHTKIKVKKGFVVSYE